MRRVLASMVVAALAGTCSLHAMGPSPSPTPHTGGTLRVGIGTDAEVMRNRVLADPAGEAAGELLSCCLARTLLVYPGAPAAEGGTVLLPDLAAELPTVSQDSRTWTFRLRPGISYAPPHEDLEVTATDFIRTVERNARRNPFLTEPFFGAPYGYVVGAGEFAAGEAPTISGLSSPDPHTLVVRLTAPFRGFGTLAAGPAWAPLPEAVVAEHEEDVGRYWASTGPYMLETYPGALGGDRIALVRNPSWDRASDPRRGAWVDRIEISPAGEVEAAYDAIEAGRLDLVDWWLTPDLMERYRDDPGAASRFRSTTSETIFWVPMNVAVPPFDDVAVRRAVNAVVDRSRLRDLIIEARGRDPERGPQAPGVISQHVFPDSITGGLLRTYAPWASRGDRGDAARARLEMSASRYDADGDGRCDQAACTDVRLVSDDRVVGESLARDLAVIGIEARVVDADETNDIAFVRSRTPIQANLFGWVYNLTGEDLSALLRGSLIDPEQPTLNGSLMGASPAQLEEWGYAVDSVPSVDDLIERCVAETGHLRARCWAELDQHVTEVVAPWVPIFSFELARVSSSRVASFTLDQSAEFAFPALDRTSLRPDAGP